MTLLRSLEGKVVIVTGSGNGIGRATANAMAQAGAVVVVSDVLIDDGMRTVEEIISDGGRAIFVEADISNEAQTEKLVSETVKALGGVNILVNNAGIGGGQKKLHEVMAQEFRRVVEVNLMGTFFVTKHVIPHFLTAGGGSIVNIASTYGLIGAPKAAAYCATKGAIINLTRQLAVDYGPENIRVNAICPGYVDTNLGSNKFNFSDIEYVAAVARREKAASMQPLGRQAQPKEVGNVAVFLSSSAASFMTGSIVTVDGGCVTTFNYGEASN